MKMVTPLVQPRSNAVIKINPTHDLRCEMNSSTMLEGQYVHAMDNKWWLWTQVHWIMLKDVGELPRRTDQCSWWTHKCWFIKTAPPLDPIGTPWSSPGTSCTNLNCRIWDIHCEEWGDRLAGGDQVEVRVHHLEQELAPDECVARKGVLRMLNHDPLLMQLWTYY